MKLLSGLIGAQVSGPIGWLIFDNPTKLNALSPGMSEDALSVIEAYVSDHNHFESFESLTGRPLWCSH